MHGRHHVRPTPSMLDLERDPEGPTLGVGAVAAAIGLSEVTTRELLVAGDIRGFLVGRNYKVLWCSLREYLFRISALPLREAERQVATSQEARL